MFYHNINCYKRQLFIKKNFSLLNNFKNNYLIKKSNFKAIFYIIISDLIINILNLRKIVN